MPQAGRRNLQLQKLKSWKFIFLSSYGISIKYYLLCDFFLMLNKKLLFLYTLDNDRRDTFFLVPRDHEDQVREVIGRLRQNSASGNKFEISFLRQYVSQTSWMTKGRQTSQTETSEIVPFIHCVADHQQGTNILCALFSYFYSEIGLWHKGLWGSNSDAIEGVGSWRSGTLREYVES